MNVDDFIFNYNPLEMYNQEIRGGIVALSKPRIEFGLVRMKNGFVYKFEEKPYLKEWVSCGHYMFKRRIVRDYFPEIGDIEHEVLPVLAKERLLLGYKIKNNWLTVNTWKDYQRLLQMLEKQANL
jgi:glucose-1-phosphate cytidylyltransferase